MPSTLRLDLRVAKTVASMIVDHPHRLHERVADRRPDKAEPPLLQGPAHCLGLIGFSGDLCQRSERAPPGLSVNELPEKFFERCPFGPKIPHGPRVRDRRGDLCPIANDAGVGQEARAIRFAVGRDLLDPEVVKCLPIGCPPFQDCSPRQPSLRSLERQMRCSTPTVSLTVRTVYGRLLTSNVKVAGLRG